MQGESKASAAEAQTKQTNPGYAELKEMLERCEGEGGAAAQETRAYPAEVLEVFARSEEVREIAKKVQESWKGRKGKKGRQGKKRKAEHTGKDKGEEEDEDED